MHFSLKCCLLFDWGDTLMRDIPEFRGPMKAWPRLETLPAAAETLTALRPAWTLALATNAKDSDELDIRAALQRVALDPLLDRVYCFKQIGHKKPARAFFQYILDDLQLPPGSVCMVGDNYEADVLGANACGIRAIWFNEHTLEERQDDMHCTIHALSALPEALKGFGIHPKTQEESAF
jgi:putative hydrolase of the HAD superfamily